MIVYNKRNEILKYQIYSLVAYLNRRSRKDWCEHSNGREKKRNVNIYIYIYLKKGKNWKAKRDTYR